MTKKHFIRFAQYVKDVDGYCEPFTAKQHEQNPRFNRERWIDYIKGLCGPNGGAR
jgi:hypothetical protein